MASNKYIFPGIFLICACIGSGILNAQQYGVYFESDETTGQKSTGIDLYSEGFIELGKKSAICFDAYFRNEQGPVFGYLLRIIGKDGSNIDLVYDRLTEDKKKLVLIYGQQFIGFSIELTEDGLINHWNSICLRFDFENAQVHFSTPDTSLSIQVPDLHYVAEYKILFGANHYTNFENSKVPPMNLRDIRIVEENYEKYYWPLYETSSEFAFDTHKQKRAKITHAVWLEQKHKHWENMGVYTLNGRVSSAFHSKENRLLLIGDEQLLSVSVDDLNTQEYKYRNGSVDVTTGNQAFFDEISGNLYTFNPSNQQVLYFDWNKNTWQIECEANTTQGEYTWYSARNYLPSAASLLLLGGYSGKQYRNTFQRYSVINHQWEMVSPVGDEFQPRYLAAMGSKSKGDSVFVLGGYGNESGNPIVSPHFFNELRAWLVNENRWVSVSEFPYRNNFYSFAPTLLFAPEGDEFYVLQFNTGNRLSGLQLYSSAINQPKLEQLADTIPYLFQETKTYGDLFFSATSQKLIALTSLYDEETRSTRIQLYSLFYPPNRAYKQVPASSGKTKVYLWLVFIVLFDILALGFYLQYKRKKKKRVIISEAEQNFFFTSLNNIYENPEDKTAKPQHYLYLFGDSQLFIDGQTDLLYKFSPLLKELFLMVLLHSSENENGIASANIIGELWPDMPDKKAKNNLAVNMGKIRNLFDPSLQSILSSQSGYWKIELRGNENILFCDYWECIKIISLPNRHTREGIQQLIDHMHRGYFLSGIEYAWLDGFKASLSNKVIDLFDEFLIKQKNSSDAEFLIQIAETINLFDMINELAMKTKCKALVSLGKHSLAKDTYTKFVKEYRLLYDVEFGKSYTEILS